VTARLSCVGVVEQFACGAILCTSLQIDRSAEHFAP
jgi:hypothetical protein